ncbi:MAG: anti-sigma factor family protein, partial [Planctomycetota bacterium]
MKCDRIREDLGAYLDNELDSARRSELDGHLVSCQACAVELERLRKLSRLVAGVPRATAPAGLAARIVSSAPVSAARAEPDVPAAREPRPRVLRLSRWTGGLAAVAAVLLVGVVTIVTLRERDAREMVGRVAETSDAEPAGTPAAGEDAGAAALDRKKLDERAETERRVFARKVRGPEKRRGDMRKKEAESKVAESAARPAPPPARVHRKAAPPPAGKAVAARTPAPSKPARPRPKGKAAAAAPAPRAPVVGKRIDFRARRGKAGPGGRGVAKPAAPAGPGEQVQAEAPRPKAEDTDRPRQGLADLRRQKEGKEGLAGKKEKDRAAAAFLAKMRKAKAPAREADVAGGEPVIRLQLRAGSPAKELERIIAAAERLGGGSVPRRAETKAVREQAIRSSARGR